VFAFEITPLVALMFAVDPPPLTVDHTNDVPFHCKYVFAETGAVTKDVVLAPV
jgi:hypothetical protein